MLKGNMAPETQLRIHAHQLGNAKEREHCFELLPVLHVRRKVLLPKSEVKHLRVVDVTPNIFKLYENGNCSVRLQGPSTTQRTSFQVPLNASGQA